MEVRNVDSNCTSQDVHAYTGRLQVQSASKLATTNLQGLLGTDVLSAVNLGYRNTSVAHKNRRQLDTHTLLPKLKWQGPPDTINSIKSAIAIGSVFPTSNYSVVTTASSAASSSKTCLHRDDRITHSDTHGSTHSLECSKTESSAAAIYLMKLSRPEMKITTSKSLNCQALDHSHNKFANLLKPVDPVLKLQLLTSNLPTLARCRGEHEPEVTVKQIMNGRKS